VSVPEINSVQWYRIVTGPNVNRAQPTDAFGDYTVLEVSPNPTLSPAGPKGMLVELFHKGEMRRYRIRDRVVNGKYHEPMDAGDLLEPDLRLEELKK
jgi:hypothetical protein